MQDTPQVSRCALEQVAFLGLYKDTGGAIRALPELSEGESEVRGPLKLQTHVV